MKRQENLLWKQSRPQRTLRKVKFQVTLNVELHVPSDQDEREFLCGLDFSDTLEEIGTGKMERVELIDLKRVE